MERKKFTVEALRPYLDYCGIVQDMALEALVESANRAGGSEIPGNIFYDVCTEKKGRSHMDDSSLNTQMRKVILDLHQSGVISISVGQRRRIREIVISDEFEVNVARKQVKGAVAGIDLKDLARRSAEQRAKAKARLEVRRIAASIPPAGHGDRALKGGFGDHMKETIGAGRSSFYIPSAGEVAKQKPDVEFDEEAIDELFSEDEGKLRDLFVKLLTGKGKEVDKFTILGKRHLADTLLNKFPDFVVRGHQTYKVTQEALNKFLK